MIKNDTTWCTPRGGAKDEKKNDKDYGSIGHPNAVLDTVLVFSRHAKKEKQDPTTSLLRLHLGRTKQSLSKSITKNKPSKYDEGKISRAAKENIQDRVEMHRWKRR